MKTKIIITISVLIFIISTKGQNPNIELTFTGIDNTAYVQLDSITVMNRTQGGDTVLFWPDTLLVMDYQVGIIKINNDFGKFEVFQNYPNPVKDQTTISLFVPEKDKVNLSITDMLGRIILKSDRILDKGIHSYKFSPGHGNLFFFAAQWRGNNSSIKILHAGTYSNGRCSLEYIGSGDSSPQLKAAEDIQDFVFSMGDELLYVGYGNSFQSGILDAPEENEIYTFQFATNIPCPGTPLVEYDGQFYNTIQIFSQCWLKENLNVGWIIPGVGSMSDNGFIEKYCYNNEPDSCIIYGGLYQWDEMMQYTTEQGTQGICPDGWHLPTDEEWKVLEGVVDSHFGLADPVWDLTWHRGINAGTNLKTISGWNDWGNGTDLFGFSALPGGGLASGGSVHSLNGINGLWWTSSEINGDNTWYRHIDHDIAGISRYEVEKVTGFSVRCLRDY